MTRTLLGCFFALCVSFAVGCGGGGTDPTIVDTGLTDAQVEAEAAEYEAQMEAEMAAQDAENQ